MSLAKALKSYLNISFYTVEYEVELPENVAVY